MNVDKDPDLRKSSDMEPTNRSWVPWVVAVFGGVIGIVLVVVAGLLAFKLFGWITGNGDNDTNAASAGAWASAVGATALAVASVWLAVQANQQARAAEQQAQTEADKVEQRHREQMAEEKARYEADVARIEKEALERRREETHNRELDGVRAILNALSVFVAEVHNHARAVATSASLTEIVTDFKEFSDSDKSKFLLESIIRTETQQMALLRLSNDCIMTARTAIFQIAGPEIRNAASQILQNMHATAQCFTTATSDNDWTKAAKCADLANEAGSELQKKAGYRFLPDDDLIASELPPEFRIPAFSTGTAAAK